MSDYLEEPEDDENFSGFTEQDFIRLYDILSQSCNGENTDLVIEVCLRLVFTSEGLRQRKFPPRTGTELDQSLYDLIEEIRERIFDLVSLFPDKPMNGEDIFMDKLPINRF